MMILDVILIGYFLISILVITYAFKRYKKFLDRKPYKNKTEKDKDADETYLINSILGGFLWPVSIVIIILYYIYVKLFKK